MLQRDRHFRNWMRLHDKQLKFRCVASIEGFVVKKEVAALFPVAAAWYGVAVIWTVALKTEIKKVNLRRRGNRVVCPVNVQSYAGATIHVDIGSYPVGHWSDQARVLI